MYYSDEHIKDLSTYKTHRPALLRLFPLSPQFCCEKVMKHWRSSAILLKPKPHGILGPPVSLKCPSCLDKPVSLSLLVFLSAFTWASILSRDHYYLHPKLLTTQNIVLKQPKTDVMTRTSGCIFLHEPISANQREKSRTFLFQPAKYFAGIIKSDNQSWVRFEPLCSLSFHSCTSNTSFYERRSGRIFLHEPFRGNVKYKPAKAASKLLNQISRAERCK